MKARIRSRRSPMEAKLARRKRFRTKMLKQIKAKPAKHIKFQKHNVPRDRKFGRSTKRCRRCGQTAAHISKYGLHFRHFIFPMYGIHTHAV